ncbi:phenylacetic acid degradation bifunctional protein PaaZ [Arsenicicoccus piscis]|uniref:Phenylacetic acid degradation protein PaaN n=1 Tax=Arsenicicoccus piscis TaxID=673954 RepID=A0ABQ6HPK3_9MICO|nr:phenylacetic acid degradation bifunctional protein PaaZ [Arsenicicoccus piscis]MCH8628854.1 phenylacetic acid degradation bifunctional protein PaaZ [Arsenicicoccus piscis]GMA20092.1 putative phenylacetic acid degradation protein PaaN [Arsenicicoccus piscis]
MTTAPLPLLVPSYVHDEWWPPSDDAELADVLDACTGEVVARTSSDGVDVAGAVDFARTVGQRELGRLTIHERALLLKQLAQYLMERKDELYAISYATGATKADSWVDIEGGIGVLFTMSSKGRRELPNSQVVLDGPTEVMSKDGSFIGTHVYTRLPGVAVQINAFNFPVWGMLEKFAPAFVAGVPTLVKPAPQTGYVAAECVRLMTESGLLPTGSIQLVSGHGHGLLDHLDYRDLVAFTGSARTANTLRQHPNVVHGGVRFASEADSLNAAILGPDAVAGTPERDAFVRSVVTEMTTKAGQKCTSIRRVLVPENQIDEVIAAIAERLESRTVVGDPRDEGVTMGALVSVEQKQAVHDAVQRLIDAGGEIVIGSAQDERSGALMDPVLLRFDDADTEAVHTVEAFGPVASILPYRDLDDAIRLAAKGLGSLVATVCTNDPEVAATLVQGIGAHHGRVLVLNRDDARTSTGHGSPMPQLIHGGPGRAGGSEELGGVRSIKHHMQRTALQGSPGMVTAVTGVWHTGAPQRLAGDPEFGGSPHELHPFRKSLAELRIGDGYASPLRMVTLGDIEAFAHETGDTFYAHMDEEAAAANPFFPGRVAHGYLLVSWAAGLFVSPDPGPVLANYGLENLRFITPVPAGDSIRVTLTAKRITPRVTDEYGEVCWDAVIHNQHGEVVATYDVLTLVDKEQSS